MLKGTLEGISKILEEATKVEGISLTARAYVDSAKAMLDGVVRELEKKEKAGEAIDTGVPVADPELPPLPPPEKRPVVKDEVPLDAAASAAKNDLLHGEG